MVEAALVIVVLTLFVAGWIYSVIQNQKRQEAMAALASGLGLRFSAESNYALADDYEFLNHLDQGSNRYAFNILSGTYQGNSVQAFDYHYETHSTDSKGHTQTHHHYFSFFILTLPRSFPELTIAREGLFSKVAQAFGYDDIDFESDEFSRKFCVRSRDKKFAYDICHPRMMEYLLANPDLNLEIERESLALAFDSQLSAPEVQRNLDRLIAIRQLMPEYLFAA